MSDFQQELENQIVETSIASALECNEGGPVFASRSAPPVPVVTLFTGNECTSEISLCTTLETEFEFWALLGDDNNDDNDNATGDESSVSSRGADAAAVLSYVALQEKLDGGIFVSTISELDRTEYLSPVAVLPIVEDPVLEASTGNDLSISPFTLGAVVAMSTFPNKIYIERLSSSRWFCVVRFSLDLVCLPSFFHLFLPCSR